MVLRPYLTSVQPTKFQLSKSLCNNRRTIALLFMNERWMEDWAIKNSTCSVEEFKRKRTSDRNTKSETIC